MRGYAESFGDKHIDESKGHGSLGCLVNRYSRMRSWWPNPGGSLGVVLNLF